MNDLPVFLTCMLSCPEREEVRQRTLANLRATDWEGEVVLTLDPGTLPDKGRRMVDNGRRLLVDALARHGWSHLLFLEDDLDFNRHLRHNLLHWRPLREDAVSLAGLYDPGIAAVFDLPPFHYFVAHPEAVYGSQAFLIARRCLEFLLRHFEEIDAFLDLRLARLAGRYGPVFYHRPSLIQHVGVHSVWGGHFHQALDFDADFRSAAPQPVG